MIEVESISKSFQTDFWAKPFKALDDVSFTVPEGKIVGFLGANGAGKTTSLKIILGFIRPNSGQIKFNPKWGTNFSTILSHIGYLPERPYFYPHLTGKEFISYMGKLNNLKNHQINDSITKWAPRLRIDFAIDRKIRNYSKGMLQRLGFVCSLIHNPDLIILDEPVSGLDPIGRKEIKDVISEINKEGKTIFFSSHIVPDVEEICDTVIFLEKGKLIYQGSIEKLIHDNQKSTYELKYFNRKNNQFEVIQVDSNDKQALILEQINNGNDIVSFNRDKLTLEEIFYKVKNHERNSFHD